jgi:hypothetical protein
MEVTFPDEQPLASEERLCLMKLVYAVNNKKKLVLHAQPISVLVCVYSSFKKSMAEAVL